MKKFIFLLFSILIIFTSCNFNKVPIKSNVNNNQDNTQILEKIEYMNTFSKRYINEDGTNSLHIYSSPIAFEENGELKEIDNSIIKSSNSHYAYENKSNDIKMYFPHSLNDKFKISYKDDYFEFKLHENLKGFSKGKIVNFKNMYNDYVDSVRYKGKDATLYFYCTSTRIKCEIRCKDESYLKELNFKIYNLDLSGKTDFRDLVVFKGHNDVIKNIIRRPYELKNGKIIYGKEIQVLKLDDCYRLTFSLENSKRMDLSFEMYREKMFDGFNDKNYNHATYLDNVCTLSEDCTLFLQNQLDKYANLDTSDIQNVYFNFRNFSDCDSTIDFYTINEKWSTVLTTAHPPKQLEFFLTESIKKNSYNKIDITQAFFKNGKKNCDNYGIAIKAKEEIVLPVSDNYQYPYYYEIIYKK